jgi:ECF sigma factor
MIESVCSRARTKWSQGDPAASERLFEAAYAHLRKISGAILPGGGERSESLLQPTSVVNGFFVKLVRH